MSARLSAIAPALVVLSACAGWVGFVWAVAGGANAVIAGASMTALAAVLILAGPRYSRPDRAAGRGEGL